MAREFAAAGHDLVLCARRLEPLQTLANNLQRPGQRIEIRKLDVTDHKAVFTTFTEVDETVGGLDRIIVNAGVGSGSALGQGHFSANLMIAETNFVAALAQAEAALELFRHRNAGHLVLISSMSALRGLPGEMAVYSASKAALAHLGEALAVEFAKSPIRVSTILPGYIRTPLNSHKDRMPFEVTEAVGVRAIVQAIGREDRKAVVPKWPWVPISWAMRLMPFSLLARAANKNG
jgi:short-subunit dehydrogenase